MNSKNLLLSYKIICLVVPFLLQSGLFPRSTGTDAAILLDAAADVSLALTFLPKKNVSVVLQYTAVVAHNGHVFGGEYDCYS